MTNPILLDDDEMDWKSSSNGASSSRPVASLKSTHSISQQQSSTTPPAKAPTSSIRQTSAQAVFSSPSSIRLKPKQEERLKLQNQIEEQLKLQQLRQLQQQKQQLQQIKQQQLVEDEMIQPDTEQQTQQSSAAPVKAASPAGLADSGLDLDFDALDPTRKDDRFGLGAGLRQFIISKSDSEASYPIEEPDWSFIANIGSIPDSIPAPWVSRRGEIVWSSSGLLFTVFTRFLSF
jgi:DNA segregation ATPase FtsK/SpoIIIE-like protein